MLSDGSSAFERRSHQRVSRSPTGRSFVLSQTQWGRVNSSPTTQLKTSGTKSVLFGPPDVASAISDWTIAVCNGRVRVKIMAEQKSCTATVFLLARRLRFAGLFIARRKKLSM